LLTALKENLIGGYAGDLVTEPFNAKDPLLQQHNVVFTPHIAWYTNEAVSRLTEIAVRNVEAFVDRKQVNVVNQK
jgi:phosphoglycerate dehydrogenase-like enzyme